MSMELDGTQSPADAIREEINKLRKEAGFPEETVEGTEEQSEETTEESSTFDFTDNTAEMEEPVITPKEQTVDYWKHRFDVIQGKYNAETGRMNEQLSFLRGQVEELKDRPASQTINESQSVTEILDELEDQYGSDFTGALDKRISKAVKQQVQEVVNGFQQDLTNVKQTQAVSEQTMFEDVVDKLSPSWRSLNVSPEFVSWVQNSTESFSGVSFQDILIDSYNRRDATKIAKIFNTYEQIKNKNGTRPTGTKADASQLVSPPKRGSSTNATIENNSGQVFTQAQVTDFYTNLSQGAYKGKDTWIQSMKAEIHKANAEGRIV